MANLLAAYVFLCATALIVVSRFVRRFLSWKINIFLTTFVFYLIIKIFSKEQSTRLYCSITKLLPRQYLFSEYVILILSGIYPPYDRKSINLQIVYRGVHCLRWLCDLSYNRQLVNFEWSDPWGVASLPASSARCRQRASWSSSSLLKSHSRQERHLKVSTVGQIRLTGLKVKCQERNLSHLFARCEERKKVWQWEKNDC